MHGKIRFCLTLGLTQNVLHPLALNLEVLMENELMLMCTSDRQIGGVTYFRAGVKEVLHAGVGGNIPATQTRQYTLLYASTIHPTTQMIDAIHCYRAKWQNTVVQLCGHAQNNILAIYSVGNGQQLFSLTVVNSYKTIQVRINHYCQMNNFFLFSLYNRACKRFTSKDREKSRHILYI